MAECKVTACVCLCSCQWSEHASDLHCKTTEQTASIFCTLNGKKSLVSDNHRHTSSEFGANNKGVILAVNDLH